MVAQLCSDLDSNYAEVNGHLDKMGYNIGMRLIEDFFAKSGVPRCANLRETAEIISKVRDQSSATTILCMIILIYGLISILTHSSSDGLQDLSEHHPHCH